MTEHTPGPWRWQGEDYRGDWGWQILVGPEGEGLIVGQALDGRPSPHIKAYEPIDPSLCKTGLAATGQERVTCVHVFNPANARLIAAAPDLLAALEAAPKPTWRTAINRHEEAYEMWFQSVRDAAIAKVKETS